jgi:hypothetical protein
MSTQDTSCSRLEESCVEIIATHAQAHFLETTQTPKSGFGPN